MPVLRTVAGRGGTLDHVGVHSAVIARVAGSESNLVASHLALDSDIPKCAGNILKFLSQYQVALRQ